MIAEATPEDFWGVGVAPNLAEHTHPSKFLGLNQLGILHMTLRDIVSEREPQNCNSDFDVPSTHLISTTPHELSIIDFNTTEYIICQTFPLNGKTTSPPASESLERIKSSVSTPNRPPLKPMVKRSDTRSTGKNVNTLDYDNYVKKDTPTSKLRLSSDTISPSSVQYIMYAGFSVLNGLAHMDSELDYGINLWLTVSLVGISRCCLLFSFCITLHTLMYIIFIIQYIYIYYTVNERYC